MLPGIRCRPIPGDKLFYLEEGIRERIVKKDEKYKVQNTSKEFSEDE